MKAIDRREFLGSTTRGIVTMTGTGLLSAQARSARADKANDRIIMGCIGLGERGRSHARGFAMRDDVSMKYVCDVDTARIGTFAEQVGGLQEKSVTSVQDFRRILDDPEVDAVIIATTDHWHGLATVMACQAGKDVYVEKPASHNIWEGRKMVEAARKYDRVVQVGTQNRSAPYLMAAREYIANGELGEIPLVKVYNLEGGGPFRCPPDSDTPEGVDYDRYLGPAPSRPFNAGHFHGGWKHWWAYSGGDMTDDGAHQLDIARWLLGDPAPPVAVNASGGKLAFPDADGDVPDTQVVSFEYPERIMTFELTEFARYMMKTGSRQRNTDAFPHWPTNATRIEFYGTRGLMYVGRHGGGWQVMTSSGKIKEEMPGRQATQEHHADFLACVRSRKRPRADIEIGHQSALLGNLGNLATALGGRQIQFDPVTETIIGDDAANNHTLRKRIYRDGYTIPEEV